MPMVATTMVTWPAGLLPDLPGGAPVRLRIDGIVELVRQEVFLRVFPGQAVDFFDGAVGAQVGGGEQEFGPHGLEDALALQGGGLRHGQQQAVALDGADQGQADAGVAAGGLDDGLIRGEFAGGFRGFDHGVGRPVLDGAPGVEIFQLDVNLHLGIGVEPVEAHQGSAADQFQNIAALPCISGFQGRLPGSLAPGAAGDLSLVLALHFSGQEIVDEVDQGENKEAAGLRSLL